jgi:hypothetical protein
MSIYAAGVAILLAWLAIGVLRLRRLADEGEVWLDGTATMNAIALDAGVRKPALVILSRAVDVPLTFGFRRSTIVLPLAARSWDAEELARALRHELEHVRREDWMMQIVARAACAVYWPHPLVWVAWRRFCLEAERACDDSVIGTHAPDAYAGQLVALARGLRRMPAMPALGMAGRSRLAMRIRAILDPVQPRGPHGRPAAFAAVIVVLALLVSIAPTQIVSAAASDEEDTVDFAPFGEVLYNAAAGGNINVVRRMLDAGADVNTVVRGDGTPLIAAVRAGDVPMIEFLLERGADVNLPSPGDGNPLIAAAMKNHEEIAELLLDRGARIDEIVRGDENALITAARAGSGDVVKVLIRRGADVNARVHVLVGSDHAPEWRTPLRMARRGRHSHIEKLLLEAGAKD